MASGDNVDVIEVVETSFGGPTRSSDAPSRTDDSGDEDDKSTGEKVTAFDTSATQHGSGGPKTPVGVSRNKSERERKIGHRRVGVGGEITYKKIQTTQIMGSIQLGIQHAVGGLASKPERDLLMQDFMTVETTNFPSEGSNHTPAHHFSEFKFKNYAPIAFRYFRDLFGIQPDDFLMSMCSAPLRELSNPGASGSIFYLTEDDEFIIKTVQHKEGEFLQTLLPGYYMNLNQNPRTLLPKFFGLYCYRCNSKNVRLIAMNNLLPSAVKLHQKYDLKGSTYKRKASRGERSKSSPTYKDLDFMEHHPEGIFLEADTYGALVKTIQRDCRVLESFKIMDYSLLVGIHNLDQAAREKTEHRLSASADEEPGEPGNDSSGFVQSEREKEREDRIGAAALNRSKSINRQRLVAHSTAMESIQAESEPIDEEDDVPPGGIPARNARGERLLVFVGIIDILQSYRLKKKLEHTWKSMIHDGDTVSVHRPGFYAQRFQDFMAKTVFKKIPSLDLPEIKGNHRKFRNLVTSYIALKHSPSKRKSISRPLRPLEGDFDSAAVAATGSTAMHATSPTKLASPTGIETVVSSSGGGNVDGNSTSSVPIATSTPVNLPTSGGAVVSVAPPPLSAGIIIADGPLRVTSYPAVLKGRGGGVGGGGASPPNPNLVPSGKIPPPVPPRGSVGTIIGKTRLDEQQRGNASSSSSTTSGRGDAREGFKLHEKKMNKLSPVWSKNIALKSSIGLSSRRDKKALTPLHEILSQCPVRPEKLLFTKHNDDERKRETHVANSINFRGTAAATTTTTTNNDNNMATGKTMMMDSRTTTNFLPIPYQGHSQQYQRDLFENRGYVSYEENDEFVSVERYDDNYIIRTSPSPFRPERGRYRFVKTTERQITNVCPQSVERVCHNVTRIQSNELGNVERNLTMNKFTYFINPGGNVYEKMSRKDKKHSETYAEKLQRQKRELSETSGGRMKIDVIKNNPEIFIRPSSFIATETNFTSNIGETRSRENDEKLSRASMNNGKKIFSNDTYDKTLKVPHSLHSNYVKRGSLRINEQKIDFSRESEKKLVSSNINDQRIVERKNLYVDDCDEGNIQRAISDSSLSVLRCKRTTRSSVERIKKRDNRYTTRRGSRMKLSTPNIRIDDKIQPETLKMYLSDNEYKDYLDDTSSREDLTKKSPNLSFLHGYASTRSYK